MTVKGLGKEKEEKQRWAPPRGPFGPVLLAVLAGLLVTMSFPLQFWSVGIPEEFRGYSAWVSFAPLLFASWEAPPRRVAAYFFLTAFVLFSGTIFWVVVAMVDYGGVPFPVALLALFLLSGLFSGFFALAGGIAAQIRDRTGLSLAWSAPLAVTTVEYLRNYAFTGFPWSNPAYSQARFPWVIQVADLTGIYGLTFLIVLSGGAMAGMVADRDRSLLRRFLPTVVILVLFGGVLFYGTWRISDVRVQALNGVPLRVALLQGNIPQDEKWLESESGNILNIYADQVTSAGAKRADLAVWPEASVPHLISIRRTHMVPQAFPPAGPGMIHIVGAPAFEEPLDREAPLILHNSAFLVDQDSRIRDRYDKSHLVPFGEYVPLQPIFSFLGPLVQAVGEFVPGKEVRPLQMDGLRLGALICYEDIFPEIGRSLRRKGSQVLVNLTNDAWYGPTSALDQHLDMGVFRAVESRVPFVRAANTGISAFIEATGVILVQSIPWQPQVLVHEIKLISIRSVYSEVGDLFAMACVAATLALLLRRKARGVQTSPPDEISGENA